MRSFIFAILLIAVLTVANAGRERRKSFREVKHGDNPHVHKRLSKHDLDGHKPVGLSPHTVYKDEWLKMTRYSKTKSTACKQKCGKHQICLVDQTTGDTDCFSKHNFREGRRLFRKFRNHDGKGLKKSIDHKKNNDKHKHHKTHKKAHPQHKAADHPQHNVVDHPPHDKKDHPQHEKVDHPPHDKKDHPQHKKDHPPHDKKDHPQHKKVDHPPHDKKDHPQHKKVDHPPHDKKDLPVHNNVDQPPHVKAHTNDKALQTEAEHSKHSPVKDHHIKHAEHKVHTKNHSGHQKKEITDNRSGPVKNHEQTLELHAKLTPNKIHGHVVAAGDKVEAKAHQSEVSLHEEIKKAAIKRLMGPHHKKNPGKHGKPHPKNKHHKGHKSHHHKGLKHHQVQLAKAAKYHVCTKDELEVMSKRLTHWFALLHARREENTHETIPILKHQHKCNCQETAVWALHQFDLNSDNHLNHTELKHLETNQNEPCLKPFIESCDHNLDSVLSRKEWCCCFAETKPPCLQRKLSLQHQHLLGAFKPRCDENGYYQKEQCHSGTGYCWCVDLNGNEIPKTRAIHKAHCEKLNVMGYKRRN